MKVRKLGQQHMKIGETFSHHPTVHTEWFNFIHALNIYFSLFWGMIMNQKQGKQISNQGQNQFKTKFFLTRA